VANGAPGQPLLYVIGGEEIGDLATTAVEAYDLGTGTWSTKASLPIGLSNTNGVGAIGTKVYLTGGVNFDRNGGLGVVARLYVYDAVRDSWTRRRDMPQPGEDGVTGVINGKLYVPGLNSNRRFYRYDPATNAWSSLPSCPQSHEAGAGGVIDGKFYVVGGIGRERTFTKQLDVYDPVANKWTTKAALPGPAREELAAAVVQGKLFIFGGTPATGAEVATNQAYDPASNTWTTMAAMPSPRRAHAAAALRLPGKAPRVFVVAGVGTERLNAVYTPEA
jgi:N-acetylneuraminic acid mutarotase